MPAWLIVLLQAIPSLIKLIEDIIAAIHGQPVGDQAALKAEMDKAVKERRFDKLHELLDRLNAPKA